MDRSAEAYEISRPALQVLFICGGAFDGLEHIVSRRVNRASMGFGATLRRNELDHDFREKSKKVEKNNTAIDARVDSVFRPSGDGPGSCRGCLS